MVRSCNGDEALRTVAVKQRGPDESRLFARVRASSTDPTALSAVEFVQRYIGFWGHVSRDDQANAWAERRSAGQPTVDTLEEQLARRSQLEEKVESLPAQIQRREPYRERRRRKLDEASLTQRLKWKITGVQVEQSGRGE